MAVSEPAEVKFFPKKEGNPSSTALKKFTTFFQIVGKRRLREQPAGY
jgi:hypothetical protein